MADYMAVWTEQMDWPSFYINVLTLSCVAVMLAALLL